MLRRASRLQAVALAHFVIDVFNSMGPVVFAFLSAHIMPLSKTQIGLAASVYSMVHGLSQPLFGWMADKSGGRRLAVFGVMWTVSLLLLTFVIGALTKQYVLILLLYMITPLGSAAFHPIGVMHASEAARQGKTARNLSLFFLAGYMGAAIGPTTSGWLLDRTTTHIERFTVALGPAFNGLMYEGGSVFPLLTLAVLLVPACLVMMISLPNKQQHTDTHARTESVEEARPPLQVRALLLFALVIALRSLTHPGAVPFMPVLFLEKGWTPTQYGVVTSLYWISGALAGVAASNLVDRFGSRPLIVVPMLLGAPVFWLLPHLDGVAALAAVVVAGGLTGAPHGIIVGEVQRVLPVRKGFASGAALGFIFATGALGGVAIGIVSDHYSLTTAFHMIAVLGSLSGVLALGLASGRLTPDAQAALPTNPQLQPQGHSLRGG
ncbi:MAG: MFS transporter [Anaerolineae bacterium]|nr:MFS transporter [Anaerolineae bacterium]